MIQELFACVLNNTSEDDVIIATFSDAELNTATAFWLEVHGRSKEYVYSEENGTIEDNVQLAEANENNVGWEQAAIGLCYDNQVAHIMELMGDVENLQVDAFGKYCVITRLRGD